jgi:hypothetical protein
MKQLEFDFNEREKQTGVDWLVEELTRQNMYMYLFTKEIEQAKAIEKEQMLNFYYWMKINDNEKNAEIFFGFSDSDMIDQYFNETYNK